MHHRFAIALLITFLAASLVIAADEDPYIWMEEVENAKALEWAKERSGADTTVFEAVPEFAPVHKQLLEIYNSRDRIPNPAVRGAWIYNFWRDADHVRGLWRRTFPSEFAKDEPSWEVVLDLDALAEAEGENWVWKGADCLEFEYRRCMVSLSRGGADATVDREFDTVAKTFVEGGFELPEAKHRIAWKDENTLWVATDFGEDSLNASGYPRIAKEWKRGTPIDEASTVFEGSVDDVFVVASSSHTREARYDLVTVVPEFFRGTTYLNLGGRLVKLDLPDDAAMQTIFKDQLLFSLRSDWQIGDHTYRQDALLAIDLDDFLQGKRVFEVLFEPEERISLDQLRSTSNTLLYTTLDNVRSRLYRLQFGDDGWKKTEIKLPGLGTIRIGSTSDVDDSFFMTYTDFVTPSSLYTVDSENTSTRVKSSPAWFDATGMEVAQYEAVSKDGTKIPYFVWMPKDFEADGANPTLLTAYGGFEVSRVPRYSSANGTGWVERGGVYVLANIRGGGEFGPKWHQAAMKEKHQNNFDDFIAVAEDLVQRKITSPKHLGIMGGSQGGLLVAGCFVQRPDLFNAVVSAVPLADMKRYNKLLAGASWMAEYGNPDTEDWEYMKLWSPYQNLDEKADYPEVFFWTNTRDDRVHPAHARKMVARMDEMGHKTYYYENTEGGHGSGADLNARAYTDALEYAYLWMKLR